MPKNINFVLFHCKETFGPESYLRRRLQIRRILRTFKCALSLIREWMGTFRCLPRNSNAVCQYVDVNWSLTKWVQFTSAYLFQIAREKSCVCVLITYMKKYEIAYHDWAEAKRAHQVKNDFFNPLASVKTTAHDHNINIQWYFHIFRAQIVKSSAKHFKELFSLSPNHFRWNGIVLCDHVCF